MVKKTPPLPPYPRYNFIKMYNILRSNSRTEKDVEQKMKDEFSSYTWRIKTAVQSTLLFYSNTFIRTQSRETFSEQTYDVVVCGSSFSFRFVLAKIKSQTLKFLLSFCCFWSVHNIVPSDGWEMVVMIRVKCLRLRLVVSSIPWAISEVTKKVYYVPFLTLNFGPEDRGLGYWKSRTNFLFQVCKSRLYGWWERFWFTPQSRRRYSTIPTTAPKHCTVEPIRLEVKGL